MTEAERYERDKKRASAVMGGKMDKSDEREFRKGWEAGREAAPRAKKALEKLYQDTIEYNRKRRLD